MFRSQDSKTPHFQFEAFVDEAKDGVMHAFFGRKGGVSKDVFEGLNCGLGSGDEVDDVRANRAFVSEVMGVGPDRLLSLYQVHGKTCLKVTAPWNEDERPEADAAVTDKYGIALSILTADCAPVLFAGKTAAGKPVIGAAHAGWKGAVGGVLDATVDVMINEYGAELSSIRAAIGPCIGKKSYEVSEDFRRNFLKEDPANERFFQDGQKAGHAMFDLSGYCAGRLAKKGVMKAFINDADTYANEAEFYSYRRATHWGEKDYGRQISAISIVAGY